MAAVLVAAILDGVLGLILDHIPRPDPAPSIIRYSHGAGAGLVYPDRAGEYRGKCRAAGSPPCLHGCPRLLQRWSPAWTVPEIN